MFSGAAPRRGGGDESVDHGADLLLGLLHEPREEVVTGRRHILFTGAAAQDALDDGGEPENPGTYTGTYTGGWGVTLGLTSYPYGGWGAMAAAGGGGGPYVAESDSIRFRHIGRV